MCGYLLIQSLEKEGTPGWEIKTYHNGVVYCFKVFTPCNCPQTRSEWLVLCSAKSPLGRPKELATGCSARGDASVLQDTPTPKVLVLGNLFYIGIFRDVLIECHGSMSRDALKTIFNRVSKTSHKNSERG